MNEWAVGGTGRLAYPFPPPRPPTTPGRTMPRNPADDAERFSAPVTFEENLEALFGVDPEALDDEEELEQPPA